MPTTRYPDTLRQQAVALSQQGKGYTSASLLAIAQKHGLNYNNLRNYLLSNHPESALLHAYAKKSAKMQQVMDAQMAAIRQQGEEYLAQMREELTAQLQRLHRTG